MADKQTAEEKAAAEKAAADQAAADKTAAEANQSSGGNSGSEGTGTASESVSVPAGHVVVPQSMIDSLEANQKTVAAPSKFVDVTVLSDGYGLVGRDESDPSKFTDIRLAVRGEKLRVPEDEAKRGRAIGNLGTEEDLHALELAEANAGFAYDASSLSRATAPEVLQYVSAHPSDAERVKALEESSEKPRPEIIRAIEVVQEINETN